MGEDVETQTKERRKYMNDDEIAQLNLFSALAMHALITNGALSEKGSGHLAVSCVEIAEDLMIEIEAAKDRADD